MCVPLSPILAHRLPAAASLGIWHLRRVGILKIFQLIQGFVNSRNDRKFAHVHFEAIGIVNLRYKEQVGRGDGIADAVFSRSLGEGLFQRLEPKVDPVLSPGNFSLGFLVLVFFELHNFQ